MASPRRPRHRHPRVTRDVSPEELPDLLDGRPRGCVAWATDAGPVVAPSTVRFPVGFDGGAATPLSLEPRCPAPEGPCEAVALVDAGVWWFELRAVYTRGVLHGGELTPTRVTAWHYGRLRETDDARR